MKRNPSVMVLGYHHIHALQLLAELTEDLQAHVIAVAKDKHDPVVQSKYCDTPIIIDTQADIGFRSKLIDEIIDHEPNVVIPVGYESVLDLDFIRDDIGGVTDFVLPPSSSIHTALDKSDTADIAKAEGIDVPTEFFRVQGNNLREAKNKMRDLSFPLFLKARQESGRNILSRIDSEDEFEEAATRLFNNEAFDGDEILLQEFVPGDGHTYGCGILIVDEEPILTFGQQELRSIPREGGTGTRVAIYNDDDLNNQSIRLLKKLDWEGFALVEYKKRPDGSYTLMEINPKIWASYPLASRNGYRFASELVTEILGFEGRISPLKQNSGQMVFPLREFYYALKNTDEESLWASTKAMIYPPAPIDIRLSDLQAYVCPAGITRTVRWAYDLWSGKHDPFE